VFDIALLNHPKKARSKRDVDVANEDLLDIALLFHSSRVGRYSIVKVTHPGYISGGSVLEDSKQVSSGINQLGLQ
jgi:hypothetical protein